MADKLITILIPVYNGAKYIGGLLESFAAFVEAEELGLDFLSNFEILVVNNCSEDATLEIARRFERRLRNLRIVTPRNHVPSAEENVFRSFKLAKGEYTWVLGVDDIVRFDALSDVLGIARDGVYDMAIFNFMLSDQNGRVETVCNYYMKNRAFEGDLVSLTQRVGFWWLIAGFSGQIVRTSLVAHYDHAGLIAETSAIYSHVTAYLECLAGRPAAIVNVQNVIYRTSDNDIGHWRRAASRMNVFDEFFWTLGYIRQIVYLEHKRIVPRDYLITMIESNRNSLFRPTVVIYDKLLSQLITMSADPSPRNQISRNEFNELLGYFEERDLLARSFLSSARDIFDLLESRHPVDRSKIEEAKWQLNCYQSSYLLAPHFAGINGDYEIYRLIGKHYAVHRLFRGALLDRLRHLDCVEISPLVFEGDDLCALGKRISEEGIGMDLDRVGPCGMRFCSQDVQHGAQAWQDIHPLKSVHKPTESVLPTAQPVAPPPPPPAPPPCYLSIAQHELRAAYKSKRRYSARIAAWVAAVSLKSARKVLGRAA